MNIDDDNTDADYDVFGKRQRFHNGVWEDVPDTPAPTYDAPPRRPYWEAASYQFNRFMIDLFNQSRKP